MEEIDEPTPQEAENPPENLESLLAEAEPPPKRKLALPDLRRFLVVVIFVAGLVLGWVGIGWWLWPVQWTNSNPWQLAPQHQRTYVSLVAQDFARTGDVGKAKQALAGWDRAELQSLLNAMKAETASAEVRADLAALTQVLEFRDAPPMSLVSLMGSTGVLVSVLLPVGLLIVAGLVIAAPRRGKGRAAGLFGGGGEGEEGEASEAELEELLAGVDMEGQAVQEGQAQEGVGPGGQPEKEEGETEEKDNEQEEEQAEEQQQPLGDLLSLFEEEDTSLSALEAFCKGMPDVNMNDMVDNMHKVLKRLREMNVQARRSV